jgi:hypothetical protein
VYAIYAILQGSIAAAAPATLFPEKKPEVCLPSGHSNGPRTKRKRKPKNGIPELEDWNSHIEYQGWRVLWASNSQSALGTYLISPLSTKLNAKQRGIAACGVDFIARDRRHFNSPPLPKVLSISSPESRNLSLDTEEIFRLPRVNRIMIEIRNPRWARLSPSEMTYKLHRKSEWAEPLPRQRIIQCLAKFSKFPVVESVIIADITVEARDAKGHIVDFNSGLLNLKKTNILIGGLMSRSHRYTISGVTLARRTGLCTDSLLFFRNSNGEIGRDECIPARGQ